MKLFVCKSWLILLLGNYNSQLYVFITFYHILYPIISISRMIIIICILRKWEKHLPQVHRDGATDRARFASNNDKYRAIESFSRMQRALSAFFAARNRPMKIRETSYLRSADLPDAPSTSPVMCSSRLTSSAFYISLACRISLPVIRDRCG